MHIKRFSGKTTEEALRLVREEFGDDAVILSTKKRDGLVEILAAIDFDAEKIEERFRREEVLDKELKGLRYELSELKTLFSSIVGEMEIKGIASLGPGALMLYNDLISKGISRDLAGWLVRKAALLNEEGDLWKRCFMVVKSSVQVFNPFKDPKKPGLLAFVGPTGSGKTTTVAKLAGRLSRAGKRIGLISIDRRRPGANEMLKTYGAELGIPLAVPSSKDEFNRLLWDFRGMDYILIDTPGRNPKDGEALKELRAFLNGGFPIKIGLVLSLTTREENFIDACRGFGQLMVDCLVFTKLDETAISGPVVNASVKMKRPVAFICDGQRIPEDIRIFSEGLLGRLLFKRG